MNVYTDGIWVSDPIEKSIVKDLSEHILSQGYTATTQDSNNHGYPYGYTKNNKNLHCRLIDSVFQPTPVAWTDPNATIVTDNHPLRPVEGKVISLLPELWHIWRFDPVYQDCTSQGYNCFMNRVRGDRNEVFYELIRRDILHKGAVSYNITQAELSKQYYSAEQWLTYEEEHSVAQDIVPYNVVDVFGSLEQVIMATNISLILETFMCEDHVVFSEKLFRALQLPRPWMLFCSPQSIKLLKSYGFDVLNDYVDHGYDEQFHKETRMHMLLDQLETFAKRVYTRRDYERFEQAATHNQQLLAQFAMDWPQKFDAVKKEIVNA
jgi:hypothetical protein